VAWLFSDCPSAASDSEICTDKFSNMNPGGDCRLQTSIPTLLLGHRVMMLHNTQVFGLACEAPFGAAIKMKLDILFDFDGGENGS